MLVAVSGGADSVALFFSLRKLGYQFEVAHCNFNLRGKESDQDEFFVKDLANKYDPVGAEGFKKYVSGQDAGILRMASTRDGSLVGAPYYTYTQQNIYRKDLLTDAGEMSAIKSKYG